MLYHLLYPLVDYHTIFNVFRYVTFRTAGAIITSLLLSLVLGPYIIERLRALHIGQQNRQLILRDGIPAAYLTVDHGNRLAPVMLAAENPVAKMIGNGLLTQLLPRQPADRCRNGFGRGHAINWS